MRKSSISNRNSNIAPGERRSRGRSTDGSRSGLLQPGFASKNRRSSSSENRDSGVGLLSKKSLVPMRRSRSQLSVCQPSVTPRRETFSPFSQWNTSIDSLKHGARSNSGTAQKPRRDVRDFSDKTVLATAIGQISNFFSVRNKSINLRQPLLLKTFLDATTFLLAEVGMPVDLTAANYIEDIPFNMKFLNYPGSLATSWMKTVYAQHSLQHVVAMWSWLVELAEYTSSHDLFEESNNEDFRILSAKDYFEMFASAHYNWNTFKSEQEIIDKFQDKLAQTYLPNYDESKEAALKSEIAALSAKCQPENEIINQKKELEEMLQHVNTDISKLQVYIKNTKKFCVSLDNKIQDLDIKKGETEGKIVRAQCLAEKLRKQVASQEMSVDDLNEMLETCEHIRGRIRSGEKCISNLKEMAFDLDKEIVQSRSKFNERMDYFNNLLVMESCSIPELSHLQIKSNVLAETYKEETEEIGRTLLSLHKESCSMRSKTQEVLMNLQAQLDEVTQSLGAICKDVDSMKEKNRFLENAISNLKARMNEKEAQMRQEEKCLKEEIDKNVNRQEIADLKQKLDLEKAKSDAWEVQIRKMQEKAMAFFKESVAITESFVTDVKNLRARVEAKLKKTLEQKEALRLKRK